MDVSLTLSLSLSKKSKKTPGICWVSYSLLGDKDIECTCSKYSTVFSFASYTNFTPVTF